VTITVTPELLRNTSAALTANMEHARAIADAYIAGQENVMGNATWAGPGVNASHATATEIHTDLGKVIEGATRLADGLNGAAALMESHEADSQQAFTGVFGAPAGT
jgi:ESAT-6 family protein